MTKVILVGYPGSQAIVPASKYLIDKYLPQEDVFDVTYLNYTGRISGWAAYLVKYLLTLSDKYIIFALDDYLISGPIDMDKYLQAESEIGGDVACVKLCSSTDEEHREYPVTTQYTIWKRPYLIGLLSQVETPWEFEIKGSKIIDKKSLHRPCIDYFTNSSISSRWAGKVNIQGIRMEDIKVLNEQGLMPDMPIVSGEDGKIRKTIELETLQMMIKEVMDLYQETGTLLYNSRRPLNTVVFGGSGFLGHALVKVLVDDGRNVTVVARNEGNLVMLKSKFPSIRIIVGDIADPWIVKQAMVNAEEVYLLSAMKHVGLAEAQVRSCVSTNITGTMNVIQESFTTKPKFLVFISSDKAAQGTGIYGCTKKIGERLMAEAEQMNPATKYRVIRYGNVWGSTGSIATKWKEKMEKGEEVILTDPEASRFFWTVKEAVDLIFECRKWATDSRPYIPKMKAVKMGVVLDACMNVWGKSPVKIIGLQSGENKVETTDGIVFSDQCEQFTQQQFVDKFLLDGK